MKRFISFVLLAIMFITSCGISEGSENDDKKAVASAFSDYINAAKNEDTKKYPEFVYESSRNHPMNELFRIMIDVYLKKGEKEKALDVFNKNKKIIKYWMPPANYVQLAERLGVIW